MDPYVAALKGVLLSMAPQATLVDLSHELPPQDVRSAAIFLAEACRWYPPGTVHLAVVDPGVGSSRLILAGCWDEQLIVAPDNGLVSLVQARRPAARLHQFSNMSLALPRVSGTFHGRDIMAPLAARLALGLDLADVGPPLAAPQMLAWPRAVRRGSQIAGEILWVDHFGNLLTNIEAGQLQGCAAPIVRIGRRRIEGLVKSYDCGPQGEPIALISSQDTLEIALNQGSAAQLLGAKAGDPVVCEL
jgi:S-adenosylmethionine hydrolase